MITGESFFCFFEESRDPLKKGQWALSIALWKGEGQKEAPGPDEDHTVYEKVLWYLNHPDHENVVLPFEQRIENECGRKLGDVVWIFWHTSTQTHHRYAKKVDGCWVDATEELKGHFVPLWDNQQETFQHIAKPVSVIQEESIVDVSKERVNAEQETDDIQSGEALLAEEHESDFLESVEVEMQEFEEQEKADSHSEEEIKDDSQLSLF